MTTPSHEISPDARWVDADRGEGEVRCGACGYAFPLDFANVAVVLACPSCDVFVRTRKPQA